jgi:hypothetical protein
MVRVARRNGDISAGFTKAFLIFDHLALSTASGIEVVLAANAPGDCDFASWGSRI